MQESEKSLESTNLLYHLCVRNAYLVIVTSRNNPYRASDTTKMRISVAKNSEFVLFRCVYFSFFKSKWN